MSSGRDQHEFVGVPVVEIEYDPMRPPPDAAGPADVGCYAARLVGGPCGQGSTERLALESLAIAVRTAVSDEHRRPASTALDQALDAARVLDREAMTDWLAGHAGEPVLYEPPGLAFTD